VRAAGLALAAGLAGLGGCASAPVDGAAPGSATANAAAQAEIALLLDGFHRAAARADGEAYFGTFAPGGVFIGTDAGERWDLTAFRAYAAPYFSQGKGWTYLPRSRSVVLGPDGRTAWFDELLDSQNYGTSRGTGVLVRRPEGWRVAQYALSFPIPNEIAKELTARIKAHEARPAAR
jgi:hypothetical protein